MLPPTALVQVSFLSPAGIVVVRRTGVGGVRRRTRRGRIAVLSEDSLQRNSLAPAQNGAALFPVGDGPTFDGEHQIASHVETDSFAGAANSPETRVVSDSDLVHRFVVGRYAARHLYVVRWRHAHVGSVVHRVTVDVEFFGYFRYHDYGTWDVCVSFVHLRKRNRGIVGVPSFETVLCLRREML